MSDANDKSGLQNALDELRSINRIIDKICRVCETNHIMTIIIDELVGITDATQGVVNLVSKLKDEDLVTVVRGKQSHPEEIPFRVSSMISGWVLKETKILKITDLDTDERFKGLDSEGGRFKSILCCPMVVRGDIIGLTTLVRDKSKGPFSEDQSRLAGIIVSQTAQILSNALLLEELARKNELLELSQRRLSEENIRLQSEVGSVYSFESIVGKSEAIKRVLMTTSKVCRNDSPVLITGPTGTGKELIARAIHFNSARKDKAFVVKNCGVKTESLLEAELFGYVKGAFTGA
ncbi:MAG: sigma 54-interacting transcriptional regulator, partial [Candidatus Zixiibacteriota bacterium]